MCIRDRRLVFVQSIGQGNPGILKLGGPVDIVFLVKTGAQLHHAEHIFAVFRGAYQGRDDLAGRCDTVQCNLDGNDVGVAGSFVQKPYKMPHTLVRIRKKQILFHSLRHDGPIRRQKQRRSLRCV